MTSREGGRDPKIVMCGGGRKVLSKDFCLIGVTFPEKMIICGHCVVTLRGGERARPILGVTSLLDHPLVLKACSFIR